MKVGKRKKERRRKQTLCSENMKGSVHLDKPNVDRAILK
jgi:hypothetical protein